MNIAVPTPECPAPLSPTHPTDVQPSRSYRTLFFSDLHLGSAGSQAGEFLKCLEALTSGDQKPEKIFINGDFIELIASNINFTLDDVAVIDKLIELANSGIKIRILKGNHDSQIEDFARGKLEVTCRGFHTAMRQRLYTLIDPDNDNNEKVKVRYKRAHVTVDGKQVKITHGHEHDLIIYLKSVTGYLTIKTLKYNRKIVRRLGIKIKCDPTKSLDFLGTQMKECFYKANAWVVRRVPTQFSLASFVNDLKLGDQFALPKVIFKSLAVTNARILNTLEQRRKEGRRTKTLHLQVGSHDHTPCALEKDGLYYINTGDFVTNMTFVVEEWDGTMGLRRWKKGAIEPFVNPTKKIPKRFGAKYVDNIPVLNAA